MKILTIDVGTGTQDIYLYDSRLDPENGFKLVLPSPTMMVWRRVRQATRGGTPIVLTGRQMGGGPSAWAVEAHARAGLRVFATPDAALTLDDDLEKVAAAGVQVISEEEAFGLPAEVERLVLRDFDFAAITETFARFGMDLTDLDAVAVGVFDHGAAPPGSSDRQFRFDYLDERIRARNSLCAFAFRSDSIPPIMSRLQAVALSAQDVDAPLVLMDTAPAAVLGATFDPVVAARPRVMIANVGNFHTLAFRLGQQGIEGVFEHHTGEIDLPRLETLLRSLADGSLKHADVFEDMGHGALVYSSEPLALDRDDFDVVVTGPRRSIFPNSAAAHAGLSGSLKPYFAVPFGDMMIAGCFGLLAATADVLPDLAGPIRTSLGARGGRARAPWDIE